MLRIERVLCPIDFSEYSAKAYDYAHSLARHYDAKLFLQHVVQPLISAYPYYSFTEAMNESYLNLPVHAKEQLQIFLEKHPQRGIQPETVVSQGSVTESILCFAQAKAADLIVMGTHGRQGIDRMAVGSVTEKVLRKARCPVLAVRKPAHDFVDPAQQDDPVRLHKILYCTDFSEHSQRALDYALSLAMEYNAEVTLLHVLDEPAISTDFQAETAKALYRLGKIAPPDADNWCTIKPTVRIGKPYREIIQISMDSRTDLVIMGVRGRGVLDLALFGSTTHRVIQLGSCPVLAVHI